MHMSTHNVQCTDLHKHCTGRLYRASPPFSSSKFYVLQLLPILHIRTILQLESIVILTLCESLLSIPTQNNLIKEIPPIRISSKEIRVEAGAMA